MKILSILAFLIVCNSYAYVDMSQTTQRANDLGMNKQDYAYAMAISGAFSGLLFGLFLWKVK